MDKADLEKIIGGSEGEFSEKSKEILTRYVIETYTPLFESVLQKIIPHCTTRSEAVIALARLEQFYQRVLEQAKFLSEGKSETISGYVGLESRFQDPQKYTVEYRGPYPTLGHALVDFRLQTGCPMVKLAKRLHLNFQIVSQLENNQRPDNRRLYGSTLYYQQNEKTIKRRFLDIFVVPPEYEDEFMKIPLFASDVMSARKEAQEKGLVRKGKYMRISHPSVPKDRTITKDINNHTK